MWKAVLVLFMTSNTQPAAMMVGQFPQTFMKKADCMEFVAKTSSDINGTLKVFAKYAGLGFQVKRHKISCLEDNEGEPI